MQHTVVGATRLTRIAPQFRVPDVRRTAEWYRDHLGFEIGEYFNADDGTPIFVHVGRDDVLIQVGRAHDGRVVANRERADWALDAYVLVTGVRELFADLRERGVEFLWDLYLTDYGV